jgi:hypothetical protein
MSAHFPQATKRGRIAQGDGLLGGDGMEQLGQFLERWFGWHDYSGDPANVVGRLLRFNRRAPSDWIDGDVEVLVVENQGVWLWGRNGAGRYVERENEQGAPWQETGEGSEEFWLHHAAFDAVSNLPASRSAQEFDAATVASIKSATAPLPCRNWAWPGTGHAMRYRGACVVMICTDGKDFWVVASAPTEGDLDWLDELNLTWDEADTRLDSEA